MRLEFLRYKPGGFIAWLRLTLLFFSYGLALGGIQLSLIFSNAAWILLTPAGVGLFLLLWATSPFRGSKAHGP